MEQYGSHLTTASIGLVGVAIVAGALVVPRYWRRNSRSAKPSSDSSGLPPVPFVTRCWLGVQLLTYRLNWGNHDCKLTAEDAIARQKFATADTRKAVCDEVRQSTKFVSAAFVASQIHDGATVYTAGFPNSERCAVFFWAVKERYHREHHPANLTWVSVGAQGARGKAPGSIEELSSPGLLRRYIAGHLETVKSLLKAGSHPPEEHQGRQRKGEGLALYNLPQGTLAMLVRAQARGVRHLDSTVGLGTFFDPRDGNAGCLNAEAVALQDDFITLIHDPAAAEPRLRYRIPPLDIVMFHARYCDASGNVYLDRNTTLTETKSAVEAAARNGGKVYCSVNFVEPKPSPEKLEELQKLGLVIPAGSVDGIVVFNDGPSRDIFGLRDEFGIWHDGRRDTLVKTFQFCRLVNTILRITPKRSRIEEMLGRLAATRFTNSFAGTDRSQRLGCIGVGLPEEAGQYLFAQGVCPGQVTLSTETGTFGGLPAAGIFFGSAIHPEKLMESGEMFELWQKGLHTCCLGAIEVDAKGDVNVSRRGPHLMDFVGSGGFANIVDCAKHIIFVARWVTGHGAISLEPEEGQLRITHRRIKKPKFVDRVQEVTFCAQAALDRGAVVEYCTDVGVFRLVPGGFEVVALNPGVDFERDVCAVAPACRFVLKPTTRGQERRAAGGADHSAVVDDTPRVSRSIITGQEFSLSLAAAN